MLNTFSSWQKKPNQSFWGHERWNGSTVSKESSTTSGLPSPGPSKAQIPSWGLRLAGTLRLFWLARGYYGEGRRWIEEALARESGASAIARMKALRAASVVGRRQGDYARAKAASEEGLRSEERRVGNECRSRW